MSLTEREPGFVLPVGTITLLLADVEKSVREWETDETAMAQAIVSLNGLVDDAVGRHGGVRPVEQGEGDSFVAAFDRASDALACALDLQLAFAKEKWPDGVEVRLRMGLHTGEAQKRDEGNYIGTAVNRAGRLRDLAHGGQTLLSRATHDLVLDRLPDGVALKDLGSHRLRDLNRPEHVFQIDHPDLPSDFPKLRSLDILPNNLPTQLTSFIGREAELAELSDLLGRSRLLTITGPGGGGKNRLALQLAASQADEFSDGVWFVDLATLKENERVAPAVADVLHVEHDVQRTLADLIAEHLKEHRALLLLDNCEQVVSGCAELVDVILRSCSGLAVLATSRERLGVEGEVTWSVPPLTLPDASEPAPVEVLTQYDAVKLFIDRAVQARPNFGITSENAPSVAEICQRLDGIPLAIELAAARVRVLSPEQIASGLHDRFRLLTGGARTAVPRQQALLASIDWSHDLLTESERAVFRRLAVFPASFSLNGAEAVASGDAIEPLMVLELLTFLVDRSLLVVDESGSLARYRMLESLRQYALDRLIESGEEQSVRHQHMAMLLPPPGVEWIVPSVGARNTFGLELREHGDMDLENLLTAVEYAVDLDDPDPALVVARLVALPTAKLGPVDRLRWLDRAIALADHDQPSESLGRAVCERVRLMLNELGPQWREEAQIDRAIEIGRRLNGYWLWWLLYVKARMLITDGDERAAESLLAEAAELLTTLCRRDGD